MRNAPHPGWGAGALAHLRFAASTSNHTCLRWCTFFNVQPPPRCGILSVWGIGLQRRKSTHAKRHILIPVEHVEHPISSISSISSIQSTASSATTATTPTKPVVSLLTSHVSQSSFSKYSDFTRLAVFATHTGACPPPLPDKSRVLHCLPPFWAGCSMEWRWVFSHSSPARPSGRWGRWRG